jgi:hypothetical protein
MACSSLASVNIWLMAMASSAGYDLYGYAVCDGLIDLFRGQLRFNIIQL